MKHLSLTQTKEKTFKLCMKDLQQKWQKCSLIKLSDLARKMGKVPHTYRSNGKKQGGKGRGKREQIRHGKRKRKEGTPEEERES